MGQLAYIQFVGQGGSGRPRLRSASTASRSSHAPGFPVRPDDRQLTPKPRSPDRDSPEVRVAPISGLPSHGHADNSLPVPGKRYVVKWLACHGLILVPDNSLPGQSGRPDQYPPRIAARNRQHAARWSSGSSRRRDFLRTLSPRSKKGARRCRHTVSLSALRRRFCKTSSTRSLRAARCCSRLLLWNSAWI